MVVKYYANIHLSSSVISIQLLQALVSGNLNVMTDLINADKLF